MAMSGVAAPTRRPVTRPRVGGLAALLAAATIVAAGTTIVHVAGVGGPLPWWVVALLFAGAEAIVFRFDVFGTSHVVSFGTVPMVLGLGLLTPIGLLVARVLGATATAAIDRSGPDKAAFNVSLAGFEAVVALGFYASLSDAFGAGIVAEAGAGAIAAVAAAVVASLFVTLAVAGGTAGVPAGLGSMLGFGYAVNIVSALLGGLVLLSFGAGPAVGIGVVLAAALVLFEVDAIRRR